MIKGVGTDIIRVERIEEAMRRPAFLEKIFTEEERRYLSGRGALMAQSAAGIYAAKEAFLKAAGTGIGALGFQDAWVSHTRAGQPVLRLSQKAASLLGASALAHLSISHDSGFAVAFVVLEKEGLC